MAKSNPVTHIEVVLIGTATAKRGSRRLTVAKGNDTLSYEVPEPLKVMGVYYYPTLRKICVHVTGFTKAQAKVVSRG